MSEDKTTVLTVAIKLPTFWPSNPQAWFAQAEAQFEIKGIVTDSTKYYYIVSALDSDTATRALSILKSPPQNNKYQAIKDFLISAFDLSESERAAALFSLNGLGDSKPTQLMDNMLALLGDHEPCFLFKHLFLQQLPGYIRTALATTTLTDYRQLAMEADKYYITAQPARTVSIDTPGVQAVQKSTNTRDVICWYHRKYGNKAKRCVTPCSFKSGNQQDQGNSVGGQ